MFYFVHTSYFLSVRHFSLLSCIVGRRLARLRGWKTNRSGHRRPSLWYIIFCISVCTSVEYMFPTFYGSTDLHYDCSQYPPIFILHLDLRIAALNLNSFVFLFSIIKSAPWWLTHCYYLLPLFRLLLILHFLALSTHHKLHIRLDFFQYFRHTLEIRYTN